MTRSHRIALDPTDVQATAMARTAGYARVAWNWGVAETRRALDAKERGATAHQRFRPVFNAVKYDLFPWCREQSQNAAKNALINLGRAWARFWEDRDKPDGTRKVRRPRFHGRRKCSYQADNGSGTVETDGARIRLPGVGWVRLCETPRYGGPILKCVVKRVAGRWYAVPVFELPDPAPRTEGPVVSIDAGSRKLATTFDGETIVEYENPRALERAAKRLRSLDKAIARSKNTHGRTKYSARRNAKYARRARAHARIAHIRADVHKKTAAAIFRNAGAVIIENLNVDGMMRNRRSSKALADAAMGAFLATVRSTAERVGAPVVDVDRFYPSSKTCSACGTVNADLGSEERWRCPSCGVMHDRDWNAARNLYRQGLPVAIQTWRTCKSAGSAAGPGEASTGQLIRADSARSG